MSRHRDVRSMNYSDEYDGYDDVYGHSVEDDYCVSPGAEQFLYDRNKQQSISSFLTEPDIEEDNEDGEEVTGSENYKKPELSEFETVKLISCMEAVRNVIGDTMPESALTEKIIKSDFNVEVVLDTILKETPPKNLAEAVGASKDRPDTHPGSSVNCPASSSTAITKFSQPKLPFGGKRNSQIQSAENTGSKNYGSLSELMANHAKSNTPKPFPSVRAESQSKTSFGSLADLTAHHLQKSSNSSDAAGNRFGKVNSPKPSFVIPKFPVSRGNSAPNNAIVQPLTFGLTNPRVPVGSLETGLASSVLTSTGVSVENAKSESAEAPEGRTTPDDWTIDLSTALRQIDPDLNVKSEIDDSKIVKKAVDDFSLGKVLGIDLCVDRDGSGAPSKSTTKTLSHECKLNVSYLRHIRLSHTNRVVSLFGKMLCKRWRSRRPSVKKSNQRNSGKIRPFDFSTPSPDSIILSTLRRR